jgi:Transcriptional regulatory protein, C terminal
VLAALLEHSGELVIREELRNKLWPADTFVDFDHSLNAAIKRLRDALGESADALVFIETLARRGYRFIAPVHGSSASGVAEITPSAGAKAIIFLDTPYRNRLDHARRQSFRPAPFEQLHRVCSAVAGRAIAGHNGSQPHKKCVADPGFLIVACLTTGSLFSSQHQAG